MSYQPRAHTDPSYSEFDITPNWSTEFAEEWEGEAKDDFIEWVQDSLNTVENLRLKVDGDIGGSTSGTRKAIRVFQGKKGLPLLKDGPICPDTEIVLSAAAKKGFPLKQVPGPEAPGLTFYVNIPLQVPLGEAKSMTGIFIPDKYCAVPQIDVIVYFHGFKVRANHPSFSIDAYWSLPQFRLRDEVNASQRNVILVAPTLGPKNQPGSLTCPGGFDRFLERVIEALKQRGPYASQKVTPTIRSIILACHSGSGSVLRSILMGSDSSVAKIKECWLFEPDQLGDTAGWKTWAASHPGTRVFIHFAPGGTKGEALCVGLMGGKRIVGGKATCVANVFAEQTTGHDEVPMKHLKERIQAATFLTLKSSCSTGRKPSREFESEVYETIPLVSLDREFETGTSVTSPKTISLFNTDLDAPYFGGNFNFLYNGGSNEAWVTYNTYFSYTQLFSDPQKALLLENLKKAVAIWDGCAEVQVKDVAGNYNDRIRLRFKLNIVKDSKNANKRTQVHPAGSRSVWFIDKDRETVMRDLNIFINSSRNVLVHELGHVWGLKDEYKDRWISMKLSLGHVGPGSPLLNDTSSIMNTGYDTDAGEFRTRYFQHFGRAILGAFWGLKNYMIPARINGRVVSNTIMGRIALRKKDIAGSAPYTADRPPFNTAYTHIQIAKRT